MKESTKLILGWGCVYGMLLTILAMGGLDITTPLFNVGYWNPFIPNTVGTIIGIPFYIIMFFVLFHNGEFPASFSEPNRNSY